MEIYRDERWLTQSMNSVLDRMIEKAVKMLGAYFATHLISDSDLKERMMAISKNPWYLWLRA